MKISQYRKLKELQEAVSSFEAVQKTAMIVEDKPGNPIAWKTHTAAITTYNIAVKEITRMLQNDPLE